MYMYMYMRVLYSLVFCIYAYVHVCLLTHGPTCKTINPKGLAGVGVIAQHPVTLPNYQNSCLTISTSMVTVGPINYPLCEGNTGFSTDGGFLLPQYLTRATLKQQYTWM